MTAMGAAPAPSFGKRGAAKGQQAPRTGPANLPKPSGVFDSDREEMFVPTKLVPILLAGVIVFVAQALVGQILGLNGAAPPAGAAPHDVSSAGASAPFAMLLALRFNLALMLFTLVYQGCHLAALYAMPAHMALRWLNFTSRAAYALGGFCAAFVVLSLWALQGDKLTLPISGIELMGGALAGLFYRVFAGAAPKAGLD